MLKHLVTRMTTTPLVGVDLGSSALKVVELERTDGRILLRRCAVAETEQKNVSSLLKRLLDEAGITATRAVVGLASPEVIVKPFEFPPMPKKELAGAIRLEAEQSILNGHTLNEMALDWHVFPSGGEQIQGLLAVVPKTAVSARLQTARAAGLKPAIVDVEGLALWNAYWTLLGSRAPVPQTTFLLNVGVRTTNLVIAKGPHELMLVRDLDLGADVLGRGHHQDWVAEVRDSLGYARAKGGLRLLDAVYVTGGGSSPDVMSLAGSAVRVPVDSWNPLDQLYRDGRVTIDASLGPLLAVAIGLALRHST
jgi:Tfp pilus assembly PilM family ATPase